MYEKAIETQSNFLSPVIILICLDSAGPIPQTVKLPAAI